MSVAALLKRGVIELLLSLIVGFACDQSADISEMLIPGINPIVGNAIRDDEVRHHGDLDDMAGSAERFYVLGLKNGPLAFAEAGRRGFHHAAIV